MRKAVSVLLLSAMLISVFSGCNRTPELTEENETTPELIEETTYEDDRYGKELSQSEETTRPEMMEKIEQDFQLALENKRLGAGIEEDYDTTQTGYIYPFEADFYAIWAHSSVMYALEDAYRNGVTPPSKITLKLNEDGRFGSSQWGTFTVDWDKYFRWDILEEWVGTAEVIIDPHVYAPVVSVWWKDTGREVACGIYPYRYDENGNPHPSAAYDYGSPASVLPSSGVKDVSANGGVINIAVWNDEIAEIFKLIYGQSDSFNGIPINWITIPSSNGAYQNYIDSCLTNFASTPNKDRIDMFLSEDSYVAKYANSDFSLPLSSIGITQDDVKNQYKVVQQLAADKNGVLKGTTWQVFPTVMLYNRKIAVDVLGTDEPAKVQPFVSDWDNFNKTAALMKDKGYFMTASYDETYRIYTSQMKSSWINADGSLNLNEPAFEKWIDDTKKYIDCGWSGMTDKWSDKWNLGMTNDTVFAYFGASWFSDYVMYGANYVPKESYNAVKGPSSYIWGATFMLAANGTDNKKEVAQIMKDLTMNSENLKKLTYARGELCNDRTAMKEVAADKNYKNGFLGVNYIGLLSEAADSINMSGKTSPYDEMFNYYLPAHFVDYFNGNGTKEDALNKFREELFDEYPELA